MSEKLPKSGAIATPGPNADFVIIFSTKPVPVPKGSKAAVSSSKSKPSSKGSQAASDRAIVQQSLQEEYKSLLSTLKQAGLEATGRYGAKNSGNVLVFVKVEEQRLQAEIHRERLSDWLHGVTSTKASPRTPRDFSAEPVLPSERLRLIYSILTSPKGPLSSSITSSASAGGTVGLTVLPSPPEFPHVLDIFPPHDPTFNRQWMEKWSSRRNLKIPHEELTWLKDHLGEKVALYFAFLRYYFSSLMFPALLGGLFWFLGLPYHPVYAFGMVGWSIFFVEMWRIKEKALAVEWGVLGVHNVESQRSEFKGDKKVFDAVTGVERDEFPFLKRFGRQLASIPVAVSFVIILTGLISTIYAIETILGEVYDGPAKKYLTLVPTVLFAGLVPQVIALWGKIAAGMTTWENHRRQTEYDQSLTLKVFALNFFVAYGSLLLTSFVYIPFGGILIPLIVSLLPHHSVKSLSAKNTSFSINTSKLHTQIVAYTLTNQIVGAFVEVGLPMILTFANKEVANVIEKRKGEKEEVAADEEDEKAYLERIREESTRTEYTVFADYAEMTLQFGYMTLFSVIWPIAPIWSLVNNFFELRSDAFKVTAQARRPVPTREASIGPWLEVLGFITWLAAITNAALVYLYQPHSVDPSKTALLIAEKTRFNPVLPANETTGFSTSNMHQASHATSMADPQAIMSIKRVLFGALVVAVVAEHGYLFVRATVRFLLHRTSWKGSVAENHVRRGELELKKVYLDEIGLRVSPKTLAERSAKADQEDPTYEAVNQAVEPFWKREDRGLEEIRRKEKTE